MSEVRLNEREQLIEHILKMPNDQVRLYGKALTPILEHPTASTMREVLDQLAQIIDELRDKEERHLTDAMMCAIVSEPVLAKEWNTPEEDAAWADL